MKTPRHEPPPSSGPWGLLLAMAGVGAGFVIVIGAGFHVSGQPAPPEITNSLPVAIGVLVAVVIVAAKRWRPGGPCATAWGIAPDWFDFHRPRLRRLRLAHAEERRRRLAGLAADPIKRKYVAWIEAGQSWSDAQIAYDLDRSQTAACIHLQPIERAMRGAGLYLRRLTGLDVEAQCCVDDAELVRRFALPASVRYAEPAAYDRSLEDPPRALVACSLCRSSIHLIHPAMARRQTAWFPAPAHGPASGASPRE
jgi:hypothetical protein